jgi:hypothetical protein
LHRAGEREEAVNGFFDREVLDRHAGVGRLAGIEVALVAQGVVLGGDDDGGSKSCQSVCRRSR